MYENLNLKTWPFQVVPNEEFAKIWAGRKQAKLQLNNLLRKMQIAPKANLYLFWANFGMGKTHTLFHLQHLCRQTNGILVPVYVVMPNKPGGFLDVYREIVAGLPFDYLGDQIVKLGSGNPGGVSLHPIFAKSPGVVSAILALRRGEIETTMVAIQWLKAQPGLSSKDMRSIGVSYRIKTAEDAMQALTTLTKLATFNANPNTKLVILIDEYQRIGELRESVRNEINAGLHGFFNANPTALTLMLAFSFGKKENVAFLLSNELKSRAEPEAISLDVLTQEQAAEFLSDLLAQFRLQAEERWAYPFSIGAVNAMIQHIAERKTLTPRRIMLHANHILAEHLINNPEATEEISEAEVLRYLADSQLGTLDTDGEIDIGAGT